MKKILFMLLSATVGMGYAINANAVKVGLTYEEAFPEEFSGGFCSMEDDGGPCGTYGRRGGVEQNACYRERKDGENNPDPSKYEELNEDWWVLKVGQPCKTTGAEKARCIENKQASDNLWYRSCAAQKCQDGWLLWTILAKRNGLEIVGDSSRKVLNYGGCRKKSSLQAKCDQGCKKCDPNEKCVLQEVKVINGSYGEVAAYIGEELCVCQAKGTPVVEQTCETEYAGNQKGIDCCNAKKAGKPVEWVGDKTNGYCKCTEDNKVWNETTKECDLKPGAPVVEEEEIECVYSLNVDIQCKNGRSFNKNVNVKLSQQKMKKLACEVLKTNMTELERLITTGQGEINSYSDLIKSVCGDSLGIISDKDVENAKITLNNFFRDAEQNASVWKTEQGKFNTARLASDLTAGVVLGTVGGVVSGNIIKKKQIEKGFDVLHCTVGGQTVADWGDEFKIRLFYQ